MLEISTSYFIYLLVNVLILWQTILQIITYISRQYGRDKQASIKCNYYTELLKTGVNIVGMVSLILNPNIDLVWVYFKLYQEACVFVCLCSDYLYDEGCDLFQLLLQRQICTR